jgi:glycerol transport system ATP-binding protein
MAEIQLRGIAHAYRGSPTGPSDYAVQPMDLTWRDGGAYALLGPSGCGKTTLLNIISGLLKPTLGSVMFDGRDVTALPPEHRNIAQVFQFPVLYDTMSVYDNLAFPLRNRGVKEPAVRTRVQEVAELLELTGDLKYRASGLSADVKQKISLGRGLVRSDVSAILFDEPLTVIDPHLKWQLRSKLKQIHEELNLTLIYVTHDQTEALTFADQVVVMYEGRVVQVGTPQELFEEPAHTFVGYFIGSPGMNLLPVDLAEDHLLLGNQRLPVEPRLLALAARVADRSSEILLGIRPEFVRYSRVRQASETDGVAAEVTSVQDLGSFKIVTAVMGGVSVRVKVPEGDEVPLGRGWLRFPRDRMRLYVDREDVQRKGEVR